MAGTKKKTAAKAKKTKRSAARKPKPAKKPKTVTINYRCDGATCTPHMDPAHMKKGDIAVMKARNTDVSIHFFVRSPFTRKRFNIPKGASVAAEVKRASGHFPYTLKCSECAGSSVPPEFIIP